jgi:hypothetical protein
VEFREIWIPWLGIIIEVGADAGAKLVRRGSQVDDAEMIESSKHRGARYPITIPAFNQMAASLRCSP